MSIFPLNKTVPLTKDIASGSTFLASLGIDAARTDLDSILKAIDERLAEEISDRISDVGLLSARITNHIESHEAHAASDLTVIPAGSLQSTNVQSALLELQEDVDSRALQSEFATEVSERQASEVRLQKEIDGERSPLRMTADGLGPIVRVASAKQKRSSATGVESDLIVPNGSLIADFSGASINFESGVIQYASGQPDGLFEVASFSGNAGKYLKYAIVLLAGEPNTLLVLKGSDFGSTRDEAGEPAFSGGVLIGFVTVKDSGQGIAGDVSNINQSDLAQAVSVGVDDAGNTASPLDPNEEETFEYYTRSDFSVEGKRFVAGTTGQDQILGLKKVMLDTGTTLTSADLTGPQAKGDGVIIDSVQARVLYEVGKVDESAEVEFSRDGGNSWVTGLTSLPGSEGQAYYHGDIVISDASFSVVSPEILALGASSESALSGSKVALIFSPAFDSVVTSFSVTASSAATLGSIRGALYSVANGIPQSQIVQAQGSYSLGSDITSAPKTVTFGVANRVLYPGTQYALVIETVGANATVSISTTQSPSMQNISSATNSGFGWGASSQNLSGSVFGAGVDLRIRILSGTSGSEVIGFGVNYVDLVGESIGEDALINQVTEAGANASTAIARIGVLSSIVVGTALQVQSGAATHAGLQAAIDAAPSGGKVILLPGSFTESVTLNKQLFIEGSGRSSVINGSVTVAGAASGTMIKYLKMSQGITIQAGADYCNISDCWIGFGKTVTNAANSCHVLVIGE